MRKNIDIIKEKYIFLWVNISLVGVVLLLLFYYVMIVNSIASKNYQTKILQDKIEQLTETNGILTSKKLLLETPNALLDFAQTQNLVEARNISYIFEGKNVAQR